jgi:hypothetical protein
MNESTSLPQPKQTDVRLETLLIEGLTTGQDIPLSQDFWRELKQEANSLPHALIAIPSTAP